MRPSRLQAFCAALGVPAALLAVAMWSVTPGSAPAVAPSLTPTPFTLPAHRWYVERLEGRVWHHWSGPYSDDDCADEAVNAGEQYPHRTFRCEMF